MNQTSQIFSKFWLHVSCMTLIQSLMFPPTTQITKCQTKLQFVVLGNSRPLTRQTRIWTPSFRRQKAVVKHEHIPSKLPFRCLDLTLNQQIPVMGSYFTNFFASKGYLVLFFLLFLLVHKQHQLEGKEAGRVPDQPTNNPLKPCETTKRSSNPVKRRNKTTQHIVLLTCPHFSL